MKFFGTRSNRGFSLVELLLVIVLIAILMALVTLSGSSMMESTNAQTEVRRLIRTVQSLRSAWLACYADTQTMIGITTVATVPTWDDNTDHSEISKWLSQYSDRSLVEEIERYGRIKVVQNLTGMNSRRIDIGFSPSDNTGKELKAANKPANVLKTMKEVLDRQKGDYDLTVNSSATSTDVYIRIR
jgi:prepilin-type N-terminal cleavage/methylation domain-containing protein